MANYTTSPYMSLTIPAVGVEPGPQYATDVNSSLTLIDAHNHSPGYGVAINPSGLNINADLPFNSNNATLLRSVRFASQSTTLTLPTDLGCLYEVTNDLYYTDGVGNVIRITQNGSLAGTPGSISGLAPPASVTYNALNGTFTFQSNTNTPGNLDAASITVRDETANSKGITINAPTALAANYNLQLPAALPSTQSFLMVDNAGNITDSNSVDNVTIQTQGGHLSVKNGYSTYEFKLNGQYQFLTVPASEVDGYCFFNYNATIVNVWAYNATPGSSGTTQIDLKVATAPGGSFSSIFSTLPAFTSSSPSNSYVDANGVVPPGTGVTAPVLSSTSLSAGSALRMDIISVMGGVAADCGIVVQFMQR